MERRGVALVSALGVLALAAALLATAGMSSIAMTRASRTARTSLRVDTESRRALAGIIRRWGAAEEALGVGGTLEFVLPDVGDATGVAMSTRGQLHRLTARRFALSVEVQGGEVSAPLARRRATLLLERAAGDSAGPPAPLSAAEWGLVTLP